MWRKDSLARSPLYPDIAARSKTKKGRVMTHRVMLLSAIVLFGSLGAYSAPRAEHTRAPLPAPGPIDSVNGGKGFANLSKLPNTVEVNLTAGVARLSLQPGIVSEVYAYNGRVPGRSMCARAIRSSCISGIICRSRLRFTGTGYTFPSTPTAVPSNRSSRERRTTTPSRCVRGQPAPIGITRIPIDAPVTR